MKNPQDSRMKKTKSTKITLIILIVGKFPFQYEMHMHTLHIR